MSVHCYPKKLGALRNNDTFPYGIICPIWDISFPYGMNTGIHMGLHVTYIIFAYKASILLFLIAWCGNKAASLLHNSKCCHLAFVTQLHPTGLCRDRCILVSPALTVSGRMASTIELTCPLPVSANDQSQSMHPSFPSPSSTTGHSQNRECASIDVAEARKSDRRRSNYATSSAKPFSPLAERAQQLNDIISDGGDDALCAAADLDREFPALG